MFHRRLVAAILMMAASVAVAVTAQPPPRYHAGVTGRVFHPEIARTWRGANTQALVTMIWYPVDPEINEYAHDIGPPGNPIFRGHPIAENVALSRTRTRFPLLLLSHGTGGTADSLDWLASALATAGYVVAGVNHPGNNALENLTIEGFSLWWERATDLSEVLDGVLADATLGSHIDRDKIGAIGFSLGGYTVLELAGARTNTQAFEQFCNSPASDAICHPPEMNALGELSEKAAMSPEAKASSARAGDSYRDKRIKAVLAIAPALGEAFDGASFRDIAVPVMLVGGTADVTVPVETNIQRIALLLPTATLIMLPGASHYTFLDGCVAAAADHWSALCGDGLGVDRDSIHVKTVEAARSFFQDHWP